MTRGLLWIFVLATSALAFSSGAVADDYPLVADKSLAKLLGEGGRLSPQHPFDEREHVVWKLSSDGTPVSIPAEMQCLSKDWSDVRNAQMPYLVFMPEKKRLLMLFERNEPAGRAALIHSDDLGVTWSKPRWLRGDVLGKPDSGGVLGLTYLGAGKLIAYPEDVSSDVHWFSSDFGETWKKGEPSASDGIKYAWNPLLVVKDSSGMVERLVQEFYRPTSDPRVSIAFLRSSQDEGKTWSKSVQIPQWAGVNEASLIQAANGDWVAACRTDNPKRFESPSASANSPDGPQVLDLYCGFGVSISKDQGKTWSEVKRLYDWGRHLTSMVLMPDGKIVMTYVVRLGYPHTADGFSQFGVEAIVSTDNGQSWDLDNRYVLATWVGNIKGGNAWYCGVQSTSTLLMPDGKLVTAFGTGYRNPAGTTVCYMDVAIIRWQLDL